MKERKAGRAAGLEEAHRKAEKFNQLIQLLAAQKRMDDIVKAASDKKYQEKLFKEFNLE